MRAAHLHHAGILSSFTPMFAGHLIGPIKPAEFTACIGAMILASISLTIFPSIFSSFKLPIFAAIFPAIGLPILPLIHLYLISGVMAEGVVRASDEGTPQGGPLSPLLSNIMLDDLDKELERRGHRFVRYADDCNIYVRSARAGERVMTGVKQFIEKKLKLKVNERKSAVARATARKFLGYSFLKWKGHFRRRIATRSLERLRDKLRDLTRRTTGEPLSQLITRINRLINGWVGYYRLAETPTVFQELDEWLRHRFRQLLWKRWKRPKTRYRELVARGVPALSAREASGSGKGPWRLSASPPVHQALNYAYWRAQGLLSFSDRYQQLRWT